MKTTAHYLKIFCFLVLPILSYACPALAVGSGNENEAVAGENKALKEKMVRFFLNYLSGDETLYQDNKPVSLADIARQRQLVWDAWVEANNRFDEQKLIGLGKLEQENSGNWDLPAELEPHAVMPYYWGCKGEPGPEGGYPLYLYMHGSGDKGQEWATGILLCQKFDDVPSAYFIPQIPNMGNYYRWWQKSKQFAWEKLLRLAFVSGNINPDKVYFFGISEGGYGSQRLASYYADYLAGTVESNKESFTDDELKTLNDDIETIRQIEKQIDEIENKNAGSESTDQNDSSEEITPFKSFSGKDLDGNSVDESLFSNNAVTVVNFWFTGCKPCVAELSKLNELNDAIKSMGGEVVGINTETFDGNEDAIKEAAAILDSQGAKYRNISIDSDSSIGKYASDIMAFPTTILVDRNGNIVGEPMLGGIDNQDNYDSLMKQIQSVIDADNKDK